MKRLKIKNTSISALLIIFLLILFTTGRDVEELYQNQDQDSLFCTIFSIALGNTVIFGSNEDYRHSPSSSFISFVPPQVVPNTINLPIPNETIEVFGQVLVGSVVNGLFQVMGGMNDQGLCYDTNSIPREYLNEQDGEPWIPLDGCWDLLWICSSVDEVIEWYRSHSLPSTINWNCQLHYADATGDAVIITASNGEVQFVGKGNDSYLVSTNFNRADVSSHYFNYPCWRYNTAVEMLGDITSEENLTIEACSGILDEVHFEQSLFSDIKTLYSTVFDCVNTKIHLYYLYDFDNDVTFDLEEEYSKVDLTSTNYTLQYKLVDNTYIIKNYFPSRAYSEILYIGKNITLIIIIFASSFFIFFSFWRRKKKKNQSNNH
ncbi:MAG: carcinine hydrolase/isopenicillin-N N-acyltransferase family protein [Candidatus Hodarchaeales archaeon]|jgi:hypothetical protein